MAEAFDPYYIWLGIPPEEQPADHYRLLGVRRFEGNEEVIVNAADQRVRHLRSMQTGKRQAETQKLLNEISAASGTLLDPDRRKEYDEKLRAKEAVQITRPTTIQSASRPAPLRTATPIPAASTLPAPLPPKPIVEAHGQALVAAPSPITAPSQFPQIVSPRAHRKSSRTIWIAIGGAACVAIAVALIGTVALTIMARRTATDTPLVAEQPAKNPGVPANTHGPQIGEKPPSVSFPPNLKQAEGTASSGPPVVGKSSGPAGSGNFGPTKVAVTARDAQKSGKTTARFVRIELPGKAKFLNLADVQVYSGSENVAVKGNATQSSTGYYGYAKLANDGNTNGQYYDSKSVSCTNLEDNPWWEVDLGAEKVLDKIVVWNRTDVGMDARLQGYKVLALDASRNVIWQVSPPEYPKPSSEFAPSGSSGGIPGSTENVRLGEPVDILKDIRATHRDSADLKNGQLLTRVRQGWLASMVFDYVPSGEYLLEATVTRTSGKDGILFAINVDGRPCSVDLDCFVEEGRGAHSGLELVNGQRLIAPTFPATALHKGTVLTNDKPSKVRVFVRKGNVSLEVDGKQLIDWKGDAASLSRMPVTLSDAGPRLAVGTWKSTYTIENLKVYPLITTGTEVASPSGTDASEPSGKSVEVVDKKGMTWSFKPLQKTDLLAGVKRVSLTGSLTERNGIKGIFSAGREPDRAEFDFAIPEECIIDTTFTRLAGNDALTLGFSVGGSPVGLVVDGFAQEGTLSGLELIQGRQLSAPDHPAAIKGPLLTTGKRAKLRVFVKRGMLIAEFDGRKIADWTPADGALDRAPNHRTPNLRNLYLGMWLSTYHVESLTVTRAEVVEKFRREKKDNVVKLLVPDEAAVAKARGELKATFGDFEQKGKKPEEKLKLSQEFVSVAASEKAPALRYALLDAARRLAVEGQDVRAAMAVAGVLEENFEGDGLEMQLQTLKLAATATLPTTAWQTAAELAGELATAAQDKARLELADSASLLAVDFAARSKSVDFKKTFKQLRDKISAQLKELELVKAGEQTLVSKPDDPAANLAVGKWNCLHLGDWDKGIPQLAKSGDAKLAAAAIAERDDKLLAAADAWSAAAESLSGVGKLAALRHSLEVYQEASESLKGLEQLKAAKRVTEVSELLTQAENQLPVVGGMVPRSKLASDALRPGLLIRVYAGPPPKSPTPALAVIGSFNDFFVQRSQLARELSYPASRLTFAGIGYIDLDKDESLQFHARNAIVLVDGNKIISNNPESPVTTGPKKKNKNPDLVRRTIKKGRHSLHIVPFDAKTNGPDVRITRDNGTSVIFYSPADLDSELNREVLFHGTSAKGRFSFGNR